MSWTFDGFRRYVYAHARVITDHKNMADNHEERTLKASEKTKTKTRTTATRLQETPEKRQMLEKDGKARKNDYVLEHKTSLLIYCLH